MAILKKACLLYTKFDNSKSQSDLLGGLAQLVERLLCKQDVNGSNPLSSTIFFSKKHKVVLFRKKTKRIKIEIKKVLDLLIRNFIEVVR